MNYSLENTTSSTSNSNSYLTADCSRPVAHGVAQIITNALVAVLGTFGNVLICVAVVTNLRLRRPSNYLLFSLAIADLIVTVVCEPLFLVILCKRTFFNDCATDLVLPYLILTTYSSITSVTHLVAISVDRFIAVVYPLHHKRLMENRVLKAMLVTSWALPTVVPIFRFVISSSLSKGLFAFFVVSYSIIFLSYLLIVISLLKHRRQTKHLRSHSSGNDCQLHVELRVALTLAIVIVVFTACWVPLVATMFVTGMPMVMVRVDAIPYMWMRTLALSNSAMNFLIYGSRMKNFREAFAVIGRKILVVLSPKCSRARVYNLTTEK
ncbi:adenosine receptor A2b-like [Oculina patagonica]